MKEHNRYDPTLMARKTTYCGTEMRSRLEARFAAGLDKLGIPWAYEPKAFASKAGQYLPDFQLLNSRELTYVEVKPVIESGMTADTLDQMAIIHESEPDALLVLATPVLESLVLVGTSDGWSLGCWGVIDVGVVPMMMFNHRYADETERFTASDIRWSAASDAQSLIDHEYEHFDWSWKAS